MLERVRGLRVREFAHEIATSVVLTGVASQAWQELGSSLWEARYRRRTGQIRIRDPNARLDTIGPYLHPLDAKRHAAG
jgi:hypothetical protein